VILAVSGAPNMHQSFCSVGQGMAQIGTKAPKSVFPDTKWEVGKYGDIPTISAGNPSIIGLPTH
jgi:hypothetical protein